MDRCGSPSIVELIHDRVLNQFGSRSRLIVGYEFIGVHRLPRTNVLFFFSQDEVHLNVSLKYRTRVAMHTFACCSQAQVDGTTQKEKKMKEN